MNVRELIELLSQHDSESKVTVVVTECEQYVVVNNQHIQINNEESCEE